MNLLDNTETLKTDSFKISDPADSDHEARDVDNESEDLPARPRPPALRGRQLHHPLARRRGGHRQLHQTQIQEQTKHQLVPGKTLS